jgi:hypothetical protein
MYEGDYRVLEHHLQDRWGGTSAMLAENVDNSTDRFYTNDHITGVMEGDIIHVVWFKDFAGRDTVKTFWRTK